MQQASDNQNAIMFQQVTSWLDQQGQMFSSDSSRHEINRVKESLISSRLRIEKVGTQENWVEIPLAETFHTQFQGARPAMKMLVVRQVNGQFTVGQLVELIPQGQQYEQVPEGLLEKLDRNGPHEFNGSIRTFTIANRHVLEKSFKDGKLSFIKRLSRKKDASAGTNVVNRNPPAIGEDCIDWYWITTTFYADGTMEEVEQFLYTTCPGEGGGGNNEDGECFDDCMAQFDALEVGVQVVAEDGSATIIDINGIKKYKKPNWKALKNPAGWSVWSKESGVVERVDDDHWVWLSLAHESANFQGTMPPGGTIAIESHSGTPSFVSPAAPADNIRYAGMDLTLVMKYSPVCSNCPIVSNIVTPTYVTYHANNIWNAVP